jgi:ABC-2 type transport system permease protein
VSVVAATREDQRPHVLLELRKLAAFFRRDFLIAWSYRTAFLSDAAALVVQAFLFLFVGKLIDPSRLPTFNGQRASYMEFVAVGIVLGAFIQLGLGRVATAIREEQMIGTLESLLMTPTQPVTIQLGAVVYDLFYVPVRTGIFLLVLSLAFGLNFQAEGIAPALLLLLLFIPFVWGLGVLAAAIMLTFKRGAAGVGFVATLLVLGSGAYFPLDVLPGWLQQIAQANPITSAVNGMRSALIGGTSWSTSLNEAVRILPASALALAIGLFAFRAALHRERRRGTLGLY